MIYSSLFRFARSFYRGGITKNKILKELEHTQWLSRDDLAAYQLGKIKKIVAYAYENVPYYQRLYKSLDINPLDIRSLDDFQHLPFLTKEQVIENELDLISRRFRQDELHLQETGGSTGIPMRFYVDDSFWWWALAMELRGRGWYGVQEGDRVGWIWGPESDFISTSWKEKLRSWLMQYKFLNAAALSPASMKTFAADMQTWKPAMFMAYTSAVTYFAQYVREHGIEGIHPRLIETTGEKLTDAQRELLSEVFKTRVVDRYGSREMGQIAFECQEQTALHVTEGCHLEIVADGKPAADGETGEVVLTCLHRYAMPFIRYKVDDMAVKSTAACACGRGLPVIKELVGRVSDFVITSDGKFIDSALFEFIFQIRPQIKRYQVYQPDVNHIEVRLAMRVSVEQTWFDNLQAEISKHLGPDTIINFRIVDQIELTKSGKLRDVISDVASGVVR